MRMFWLLCWVGFLAACATHRAVRVSCDSNLRAINAVTPAADGPLADPASAKHTDGAP